MSIYPSWVADQIDSILSTTIGQLDRGGIWAGWIVPGQDLGARDF